MVFRYKKPLPLAATEKPALYRLSPKGKAKGTVQVAYPSSVLVKDITVPVDAIEVNVVED